MTLGLKAEHLRRYRDLAWLLWKHGRADWVKSSGLDQHLDERLQHGRDGPESFARDLESLGPTFVKIGQLLASRSDLLPAAYLSALSRLQDDVKPVHYTEIEAVIASELKARPARIFKSINPLPLAAASLAQVHAAKLRDGREVVVKVQRPGIQDEIRRDFEAFLTIARLGNYTSYGRTYQVEELVHEFKRVIEAELDYRLEVDNLRTLGRNLQSFRRLVVPCPFPEFSSARVLTMERIAGASVDSISPVVFTEVDGAALGDELFAAYLKQILIDGFFHADPHPGNVLLTTDHRLALIDLGMIGRVDSGLRHDLLQLLIALSQGRGHDVAEIGIRMGTTSEHFQRDMLVERVSTLVMQNAAAAIKDIEAGRLVLEVQKIAAETGMRLPNAMTLVGKTLLNLDAICRRLAPGFRPNESIRRHTAMLVRRRLRERATLSGVMQSTLDLTEVVSQLPRRLHELLTQVGRSGIRLDVDAFDEKTFLHGFEKVANRITTGLILAALIIGAALLMRIETDYKLWGYPGLAILLFLAAACGGTVLIVQIVLADREKRD